MNNAWDFVELESVSKRVSVGHVGETSSHFCGPEGTPLIRSQNVRPGVLDLSDVVYVTNDFHKDKKKSQLFGNEVLVVRVGQNRGDCCIVPEGLNELNCANIVFVRPHHIHPKFLELYFRSRAGRSHLLGLSTGSAQSVINTKAIANMEIPFPPIQTQKAIAHILGTLDDKIELNRQTNKTLEAIAKAIFKSWFVDFDPVHYKQGSTQQNRKSLNAAADEKGASTPNDDPTDAARYSLSPEILDLFPDSFQDSELGEIPVGWTASTIDQEFDVTMGQSPPGSTYNEDGAGLEFYQGCRDFGFRFPTQRVYCTDPKRYAKALDTLMSVRAPVGDLNVAMNDCCIGRGVAAMQHRNNLPSYTYYCIDGLAESFSTFESAGTVFGSINKKSLGELQILKPCNKLEGFFQKLVSPLDEKILSLTNETKTLETLRDTLLPKLISGELPIKNAEKFLEQAGV